MPKNARIDFMTLDTSKHSSILTKILKDFYTDPEIGPSLGFKGGTAAYMFYGLDRFSIDLDFDLLDEANEDLLFKKIKKIASAYGKIKEAYIKRFNLFIFISYEEKAQNIKIEINRRKFGSNYQVSSYFGIPMKIMVKEDMFAHKLVAMYERLGKTNRDIYDVRFFLQNDWPINEKIVAERTGEPLKVFMQKCADALEKFDNSKILAGIGELLNEKQKIWVKSSLKRDVLFLLKARLAGH